MSLPLFFLPLYDTDITMAIKFLNSVNADSGVLYVDAINNRVGVGTTSPVSKLHLYASASGATAYQSGNDGLIVERGGRAAINLLSPANSDSYLFFGNPTAGNAGYVGYENTANRLVIKSSDYISLLDSTGEVVRVDGGNVGIGTTNPQAKLDVSGGINVTQNSYINWGGGSRIVGQSSYLRLQTSSQDRISITNTGNVGIGTTAPTEKFNIEGGNILVRNGTEGKIRFGNNSLNYITYLNDTVYFRANGSHYFEGSGFQKGIWNSSGNLGVGTTSPTQKLEVAGAALIKNSNVGLLYLHNTSNYLYGDLNGVTILEAGDNSRFYVNGSEHMRITSAGNVGIGTTSPAYKLDIDAGGSQGAVNSRLTRNFGRARFHGVDIIGYDDEVMWIIGNNSSTNTELVIGNSWDWDRSVSFKYTPNATGSASGGLQIGQLSKNNANWTHGFTALHTNGSERLRIDSSGKVGIGTTSPSNLLHIHASGNNASALIIEDDDRRLQLGRDMIEARLADGSTVANLYIQPNGNTAFATTSGNVGIGTTVPAQKLHVEGSVLIDAFNAGNETGIFFREGFYNYNVSILAYDHNGAGTTPDGISINGYDGVSFSTGSNTRNERMRITQSGNVGIGTTSPAYKLDINGSVNIASGQPLRWGSGDVEIINSGHNLVFKTYDGTDSLDEHMRITSGGNVGIGTTNPLSNTNNYGLHLDRGDHSTIILGDPVNNSHGGFIQTSDNKHRVVIGANVYDDRTGSWSVAESGKGIAGISMIADTGTWGTSLNFWAGDTDSIQNRMVILANGNVGIGTTSPDARLEVNTASTSDVAINANERLKILGNGTMSWGASNDYGQLSWDTGYALYRGQSGKGIKLQVNSSSTVMTLTTGGNVGIGTTSPESPLQVSKEISTNAPTTAGVHMGTGSSGGYGTIQLTGSIGGYIDFSEPGVDFNGRIIYNNSGDYMAFSTGAAERLRISGGNVGIGTTSPSQKLEVNGNVKADNFIGGNDSGIYSFNDTVNASTSEDIFSISNDHGAQSFRVTFVCSTSGYSVAKTFEVVHGFGKDPVFFKVVDTGAYNSSSADHDFDVSFTNSNTDTGVTCSITNNSTTINADIVTTVFLGGSPTAITVTAL